MSSEHLVVDASVLVELLLGGPLGEAVAARVEGSVLHAPAHVDAEVLSALGRLHRAEILEASAVATSLIKVAGAPIARHELPELLSAVWDRRDTLRLADALYVELADRMEVPLVTTDGRLARAAPIADLVSI